MKIEWPYLVVSLILLLPAMPYSAALRKSLASSRRRTSVRPLAAAGVWQNWLDLLRTVLGAFLLNHGIVSDPDQLNGELTVLVLEGSILILAVFAQTIRPGHHVKIVAPVFYLCGLTLVLGGGYQGAFAVVSSWVFAAAAKNMAYQLPAMAVALLLARLVLGFGSPEMVMLNCGLMLLPPIIALLFKKRLLVAAVTPAAA